MASSVRVGWQESSTSWALQPNGLPKVTSSPAPSIGEKEIKQEIEQEKGRGLYSLLYVTDVSQIPNIYNITSLFLHSVFVLFFDFIMNKAPSVCQMLTSFRRAFPSGCAVQDLTHLLQHGRESPDPISIRYFGL